jgi:5-methyltetrahydrofolate--homocysteine methyltransferase
MNDAWNTLLARLKDGEVLLADGAWGTQMQKQGLQLGDCPEEWNVTRAEDVLAIARGYFSAGSDFCLTNTFGGNRYRLTRQGFAARLPELNAAGLQISLKAAQEFKRAVAASVGPTGEYIEPEGMLSRAEMQTAYREQMDALKSAGAEAVCVETMYVVDEAVLAVKAAKELGLYCMANMTFDSTPEGYRTMLGATVGEATRAIDEAGADVVGSNCGNGIREMVEIARVMRQFTQKPLMLRSNAGLPRMIDNNPVYDETPQMMADAVKEMIDLGVNIVGGCCGTTPDHIKVLRELVDRVNAALRK